MSCFVCVYMTFSPHISSANPSFTSSRSLCSSFHFVLVSASVISSSLLLHCLSFSFSISLSCLYQWTSGTRVKSPLRCYFPDSASGNKMVVKSNRLKKIEFSSAIVSTYVSLIRYSSSYSASPSFHQPRLPGFYNFLPPGGVVYNYFLYTNRLSLWCFLASDAFFVTEYIWGNVAVGCRRDIFLSEGT